MQDYIIIIFFSLVGGLFSLLGGLYLTRKKYSEHKFALYATPFAAGALLAAVFLDLLPDGLEESKPQTVFVAALIGILLFFIAERFLRWFHHHHADDALEKDPSINLIIAGDTIHNALDGIAIAAAFLVSVPTGIVTTFAVAAHEIPQEIGDFGLLLAKGLNKRKVILINILSALATTIAAVITYSLGSDEKLPTGILLGLSAGFLLYIALSDIIPTIHEKTDASKLLQLQTLLLIIGVVAVGLAMEVAHEYIDLGEPESANQQLINTEDDHESDHSH